jgi:hypothetical protein
MSYYEFGVELEKRQVAFTTRILTIKILAIFHRSCFSPSEIYAERTTKGTTFQLVQVHATG